MILVDTSVWIDHLRTPDRALTARLNRSDILGHPFVLGEIALGTLRQRDLVLGSLRNLPQAEKAEDHEVLGLIERARLHGTGIGYVDAHLLCSTRLTADAKLWTRDTFLRAAAQRLSIDHTEHAIS